MTPDRRVTAKLLETKQVYQSVQIRPLSLRSGKMEIENQYDFLNLNEFIITWEVVKEGVSVESGQLESMDLLPHSQTAVILPYNKNLEAGKEYFLNMYVSLKNNTRWADAGHQVAAGQFALTAKAGVPEMVTAPMQRLEVTDQVNRLQLDGPDFRMVFDKEKGTVTSLVYDDREILHDQNGLMFNWYRSVSNDKYTDQNYHPTTNSKPLISYALSEDGKSLTLISYQEATIDYKNPVTIPWLVKYTIYGNGTIDVDATFTKPLNSLIVRRLGLQAVLSKELEQVEWYGRGPYENYPDRKRSTFFRQYRTTVTGMEEEHYVRAQSMGNREEVRWVQLTDNRQKGIRITSKDRLNFSALHFTDEDLWTAKHDFELDAIRRPEIYLSLDCIQQGLGNASCGPRPLPEYMIPENQPLSYAFRIEPVR